MIQIKYIYNVTAIKRQGNEINIKNIWSGESIEEGTLALYYFFLKEIQPQEEDGKPDTKLMMTVQNSLFVLSRSLDEIHKKIGADEKAFVLRTLGDCSIKASKYL